MGRLLQTTPLSEHFSTSSKTDCTHFIDKETRVLQLQLRFCKSTTKSHVFSLSHTWNIIYNSKIRKHLKELDQMDGLGHYSLGKYIEKYDLCYKS